MQITNAILHLVLLKLSESFRQVVKPISKAPAMINMIQAILFMLIGVKIAS